MKLLMVSYKLKFKIHLETKLNVKKEINTLERKIQMEMRG